METCADDPHDRSNAKVSHNVFVIFFVIKTLRRVLKDPVSFAHYYNRDEYMETEQRKNRLSCLRSLVRSRGRQRQSLRQRRLYENET